jgi:hypothetical protein
MAATVWFSGSAAAQASWYVLLVRNIPQKWDVHKFKDFFELYGHVQFCQLTEGTGEWGRGNRDNDKWGKVEYAHLPEADWAINCTNGAEVIWRGEKQTLRVMYYDHTRHMDHWEEDYGPDERRQQQYMFKTFGITGNIFTPGREGNAPQKFAARRPGGEAEMFAGSGWTGKGGRPIDLPHYSQRGFTGQRPDPKAILSILQACKDQKGKGKAKGGYWPPPPGVSERLAQLAILSQECAPGAPRWDEFQNALLMFPAHVPLPGPYMKVLQQGHGLQELLQEARLARLAKDALKRQARLARLARLAKDALKRSHRRHAHVQCTGTSSWRTHLAHLMPIE